MTTRVRHKAPRIRHVAKTAAFRLAWHDSQLPATDIDRQMLTAAKRWYKRQLQWCQFSMVFALVLGTTAVVIALVAAGSLDHWPLLVSGILELTFVPCVTVLACGRYRRMIALVSLDLENGVVGIGEGRVRSLLGIWRLVQDIRTHRVRLALAACFNPRSLRPGTVISYRYALRSALVLGLEPPTTPAALDLG